MRSATSFKIHLLFVGLFLASTAAVDHAAPWTSNAQELLRGAVDPNTPASARAYNMLLIGDMKEKAHPVIPQLVDLMFDESNSDLGRQAARALGSIGPYAAGIALERFNRDGVKSPERVRRLMELRAPGYTTVAILLRDPDSAVRTAAARSAWETLHPRRDDTYHEFREEVVRSVPRLIELLEIDDPEVKRGALRFLVVAGPAGRAASNAVAAALWHDSSAVRDDANWALGLMLQPQEILAAKLANRPKPRFAGRGLTADVGDLPNLIQLLKDPATPIPDARVACFKIRKLGSRAVPAIPALLVAMDRAELVPDVSQVIGELGLADETAIAKIKQDRTRRSDPTLSRAERVALAMAYVGNLALDSTKQPDRDHLDDVAVNNADTVEICISRLKDPEARVRDAAIRTLHFSPWYIGPAISPLIEVAKADADPSIRTLAMEVLRQALTRRECWLMDAKPRELEMYVHSPSSPPDQDALLGRRPDAGDKDRAAIAEQWSAAARSPATPVQIRTMIREGLTGGERWPAAIPFYYEFRNDPGIGPACRLALCSLGDVGEEQAVDCLIRMLHDEEPASREVAISWGVPSGRRGTRLVYAAVTDANPDLRKKGIDMARRTSKVDGPTIDALAAMIVADPEPSLRSLASAAVRDIIVPRRNSPDLPPYGPTLIPHLLTAATSTVQDIRKPAVETLEAISPQTPIPEIAETPPRPPALPTTHWTRIRIELIVSAILGIALIVVVIRMIYRISNSSGTTAPAQHSIRPTLPPTRFAPPPPLAKPPLPSKPSGD